jgi:predicted phosphodiesterase
MRIALFSDIHGNLPALETVLTDIRRQYVDAVYCLGDLVGYAPFPNEATDRIRREGVPTIMGNYDDGVGFDRDECDCAYREPEEQRLGDRSFTWTKAHVTLDNKAFLRTLQSQIRFQADGKRVLLVHGSPRKINEYLSRRTATGARVMRCSSLPPHRPYSSFGWNTTSRR